MNIQGLLFISGLVFFSQTLRALEPGFTVPRSDTLPKRLPAPTEPPNLQVPSIDQSVERASDFNQLRFRLNELQFSGNTVFSEQDLQEMTAHWLGKDISMIDLETIRFELAQTYRRAGYINSGVLLPRQHIEHGVVRMQIVEGRLTDIKVSGAERLVDRYIQSRLQAESDEPLNQPELLDRFQSLLSDPLIERLNGILKPGAKPGESMLDLEVTRRQPYALNFSVDNYTPPSVGAYTGRLDGVVRNLTGWGDYLDLNLNYSEGLQGLSSFFSLPIAASGTRLNLNYQGNQSKIIDNQLKSLNIENDFFHLSAGLSHPLYLTSQRSFIVDAQFAYRYSRNFMLGTPLGLGEGSESNGKTKVSVFRLAQNYLDKTPERVISVRSTFNIGAEMLGSTAHHQLATGVDAQGRTIYFELPDSRFFSWLGQLRYVRQLGKNGSELFVRGDLQLASESLLPLERFALGGIYTIRGYRQNELVRDNGYALATEIRYPLLTPDQFAGHSLKLVPFIDYGHAWNHQLSGRTLWSMGLGLQWQWKIVDAEFYWAQAMNQIDASKQQYDIQDDGIHFRLSLQLL